MTQKVTSADVHVGRDGWMFFLTGSNNLIDYYNDPTLFGDDLVQGWLSLLGKRIDFFDGRDTRYVHLFVPNKLTVYREYFTGELKCFDSSPLRKLQREITEQDDAKTAAHVVNPIDYFNVQKENRLLYWKTDTHWTFYGAFSAYQLICRRLGKEPNDDLVNRNKLETRLVMYLGSLFNPPIAEDVFFFDLLKDSRRVHANDLVRFKEENGLHNIMDLHVGSNVVFRNENAPNPEKVILFGDSFSQYRPHLLTGMFAETFREVHFVWSVNLDKDYIKRVDPDIVVTETIERFMPVLQTDNFNLDEFSRKRLEEYKSRHNLK